MALRNRIICTPLIAFAITGCGINALRVEYAGKVGVQGSQVALASSAFLHRVDIARQDVSIEMMAADPICGRSPALVLKLPKLGQDSPGWLCAVRGTPDALGAKELSLRPLTPELKPTIELIGALSDYSDSLTEIVEGDVPDASKPLADALELAEAAQGSLFALTGASEEGIPASDDPRVQAVLEFVKFVGELRDEASRVSRIREVLKSNPEGAGALIRALREHLAIWNLELLSDEGLRTSISGALLRRNLNAVPPATPELRRKAATAFYALQGTGRVAAEIHPALVKVLSDLEQSDRDLRRVIIEHPKLSAKERRRVAEINRQRVVQALNHLTALINSFRGA